MNPTRQRRRTLRGNRGRRRRGGVLILTMIFLSVFTTLALSFGAATNMNLQKAHGSASVQNAQLAAESGLEYMVSVLATLVVPSEEYEDDVLLAVANHLAAQIDAAGHVGPAGVSYDGVAIRTPRISCSPDGHAFAAEITLDGDYRLRLTVYGQWRRATRTVQVVLEPDNTTSAVFNYGIASKGKIILAGDGSVLGANEAGEANILSATYTDPEAVSITGNCTLDGEVYTSNPDSTVQILGKPTISGTSDKSLLDNYLHIGVGDPVFPEIDTSPYESLATNVFDPSTDTAQDVILENIRIPAGTNPVFTANTIIRGVLVIEEPNDVKFAGDATIVGTIVTEDPGDWTFYENQITFAGNVQTFDVNTLPTAPQFEAVKQLPGTMLLAPGFGVTFTGSFSTINGAIAADKFTMTGNAGGTVKGPIICYGDTEFELLGSSKVTIDRSEYDHTPIGFKLPVRLIPVANTYLEM